MNIEEIRKDFPFFTNKENLNIAYLDNAATSHKPKIVIDGLKDYYEKFNSNANRGAYKLSIESTRILEDTREKVRKFINAEKKEEIIFTKSATESLNLIAYSYAMDNLNQNDEILISIAEHHSNLVVWQNICKKTGVKLKYFYLDQNLNFDLEDYKNKITQNTKIISFTAQSNVLSFDVPVREMIKIARIKSSAKIIIDAAQAIAHEKINVKEMDCDFLAFSGHKMYAGQGVGVLYGRYELLNNMTPFLFGGDMIEYVMEQDVSYAEVPTKFEAGTTDIAAIYTLSLAIDYMYKIGLDNISMIENKLVEYCINKIKEVDNIDIYYPNKNQKGTNIAFNIKDIHPHDVSQILDFEGVNIRVGHHCAQPLHRYLGINSSCRVSFAFYNTFEEIDKFIDSLKKVKEVFYGN